MGVLIFDADEGRDQMLLKLAYFSALRVSELASLRWDQITVRDSGEAMISVIGKGEKLRRVLLPAATATEL